jgi:hypothetical protein
LAGVVVVVVVAVAVAVGVVVVVGASVVVVVAGAVAVGVGAAVVVGVVVVAVVVGAAAAVVVAVAADIGRGRIMKKKKRLYEALDLVFGKGKAPLKKYQGGAIIVIPSYLVVPKAELGKLSSDAWMSVEFGLFQKIEARSKRARIQEDLEELLSDEDKSPADLGFEP